MSKPIKPADAIANAEAERYKQRIGVHIRAIRLRRGMIRKDLSKHSDVSERYLAQAEAGKANISIAVLWRIAHALEVKLTELLPDSDTVSINSPLLALLARLNSAQQEAAFEVLKKRFAKPLQDTHGVALIGLRGAGKSHLGRLLAEEYQLPFIRLGEVIEKLAQMRSGEIFSLCGQRTYRRLEQQALAQVLQNHPLAVLETGGSLVTQPDTFQRLQDSYFTVWIKASAEEHMSRVLAQGDTRPMAGNTQAMQDLKLILAEREADYRQAHYTLDTSGRKVAACFAELARQCQPYVAERAQTLLRAHAE